MSDIDIVSFVIAFQEVNENISPDVSRLFVIHSVFAIANCFVCDSIYERIDCTHFADWILYDLIFRLEVLNDLYCLFYKLFGKDNVVLAEFLVALQVFYWCKVKVAWRRGIDNIIRR